MHFLRLVLACVATAAVLNSMATGTATAAPEFLCPGGYPLIPAERFPVTWNLGNSKSYPDGARTCSWRHQGAITYRCKGPGKATAIVVVGKHGGRNPFSPNCNGNQHTINTKKAYSGLRGDVHIHWHTGGLGQYTDGMLRVA